MDRLEWNMPLKWMIWGCPHWRRPPFGRFHFPRRFFHVAHAPRGHRALAASAVPTVAAAAGAAVGHHSRGSGACARKAAAEGGRSATAEQLGLAARTCEFPHKVVPPSYVELRELKNFRKWSYVEINIT